MRIKFSLVFCIVFALFSAAAQEVEVVKKSKPSSSVDSGTIEGRFDFVMDKSSNYQDSKVVKVLWLEKLKIHTLDSIQIANRKLKEAQLKLAAQSKELKTTQRELILTKADLNDKILAIDSFPFLGMQMAKQTFMSIIFSIILLLVLLVAFYSYRFKNSNTITEEAKKNLSELELEFEEYKVRALEREQRAMRLLQDELNKNKKASK